MQTTFLKTIFIILSIFFYSNKSFSQNNGFEYSLNFGFTLTPNGENVSAFSISPLLEVKYFLGKNHFIGGQLGLTYVSLNRNGYENQTSFDIGNPILMAGFANHQLLNNLSADWIFKVGIPLATFPGTLSQNRLTEFNYNNANSSYGWRDPFVWLMNIVPIVGEANFRYSISRNVSFNIKAAPSYLISINSRPSRFALSSEIESSIDIENLTVRLGWASFYSGLSLENNLHNQNSLFIGCNFDMFNHNFETDFNLNIDRPNGILEETAKPFWGIVIKTGL